MGEPTAPPIYAMCSTTVYANASYTFVHALYSYNIQMLLI